MYRNRFIVKNKNNYIPYILISIFLSFSVLFPLIKLISNIDAGTFNTLINSLQFKEAVSNSLIVTMIATTISILIAYLLAFAIHRTNIKHKAILTVLLTLPMLIPSISHGLGLINLFGQNGIITNFFNVNFNIIGFNGILIGSILYSFPVAFLMLSDAFNYIDNSMYESAEILGLNKFQIFQKITFYYLKKPLFSSIFAVFTLIFTDYGIPLAVGGRYTTLPLFLYREVIGLLDFSKGTLIGMFLLIPALISFLFDLFSRDKSSLNFVNKEYCIKRNKWRDFIFNVFVYLVILFLLILFGSFIYLAFMKQYPYNSSLSFIHFEYMLKNNVLKILFNSLIISLFTSVLGTVIAYTGAYITARTDLKLKKILHIIMIMTLAIPGIVLGLGFMLTFKNTFIYRTFAILILVNIIHFIASPYLMAYNALGKINKNYETIGLTCGVKRWHLIKDVIIPNSLDTILEMLSYFFVNSMITISAVVFLFSSKTTPLSLLINQYEGQMMYEEAAIISLVILFVNLIVKGTVYLIKRKIYNKRSMI